MMNTLVMKMCSKKFQHKTHFDKGENDLKALLWAEWMRAPNFTSRTYDSQLKLIPEETRNTVQAHALDHDIDDWLQT